MYILKSNDNILFTSNNKKKINEYKNQLIFNLMLGNKIKDIQYDDTPFGKFPKLDIVKLKDE